VCAALAAGSQWTVAGRKGVIVSDGSSWPAGRLRVPEAWAQLSPQELQIAQLAADGLTNREIGECLYLSHRTVGSHLYRLFPKLGITSRSQLAAALATGVADAQPLSEP
jgi:DNA-binding CsgD family transcriptional regulator